MGAGRLGQQAGHSLGHRGVGAAVEDDTGALGGQCDGDGVADPFGRTGHEGELVLKVEVHGVKNRKMEEKRHANRPRRFKHDTNAPA